MLFRSSQLEYLSAGEKQRQQRACLALMRGGPKAIRGLVTDFISEVA